MPSYRSDLFNVDPYYDDFDETKNYQKILFRPGYSVQARELSQLQTMLQNQIERFGNHVFKDGSKVYGAESAVQTVDYIKVTTDSDYGNFIGYEISQTVDGVTSVAKVIHAETINNEKYFFVQVVRGSLFSSGTLTSNITGISATGTLVSTGSVKLFSVSEGIFFIDGFFVRTDQQYTANITSSGSIDVAGSFGFDIERNYIGSNNDSTLLDPAGGSYNFNAPGGDRYQLNLNLNFHETSQRDNFVPLANIDSAGDLTNQTIYSDYQELEKTLARRTEDESGSYIVDPFELEIKKSTDDSNVTLGIGSGKAYLLGYEFENQSVQNLDLSKARTTEALQDNETISAFDLFSYIVLNFSATLPSGLGSVLSSGGATTTPVSLNIYDDSSDTQIGITDVISIQKHNTGGYRFYLTNIRFDQDKSFSVGNVSLRVGEDELATGSGHAFVSGEKDSLIFPVEIGSSVKTLRGLEYRTRLAGQFTTIIDGSTNTGKLNLGSLSSNVDPEFFDFVGEDSIIFDSAFNEKYYHLFRLPEETETATELVTTASISKQGGLLTITGIEAGTYVLLTTVQFRNEYETTPSTQYTSAIRRKTLQSGDNKGNITVDGSDVKTDEKGRNYIQLNHADIVKINSVTIAAEDPRFTGQDAFDRVGVSVITDFTFDNGQRDYSYDYGRLYFTNTRESTYNDENNEQFTFRLNVQYDYFRHDGTGPITVDSYPSNQEALFSDGTAFGYSDIPLYTSAKTGKTLSLVSCIDYRYTRDEPIDENGNLSVLDSSYVPVFQIEQSRENDILKVAHEYYLPRIDKLVLRRDFNEDGTKFSIIQGQPNLTPEEPADRENSLTLYKMIVPPYTHNPNDIEVEGVSHKRYTMREIGEVDKRLENVELFTSLSNIESKIDATTFLSDSGNELEKRAILVDDFSGHEVGDVSNDNYRCSIDFQNKELRPSFEVYNYGTTVGSVQGDLRLHSNGIITAATASENPNGITLASQTKGTETLSVNPYQLTNWVGSVEVDNPFDLWFDDRTRPTVKTNTVGENNAWLFTSYEDEQVGFGSQWNDWESIWFGVPFDKNRKNQKLEELLSVPKSNDSLNVISSHFKQSEKINRTTKSIQQKLEEVSNRIETFPDHIKKTLRDKVVDLSVVPFVRAKDIVVTVNNMKPNTNVNVYLDDVLLNETTYTTDDSGKIVGTSLSIPSATFLTGNKTLKFTDSLTSPTTIAETFLTSQGIFESRSQGMSSIRPLIRRRQTVSDSGYALDVNTRKSNVRTNKRYQWLDPLAQTFFVDESENPQGLFLQNLHLYFATKDSTLPVTVQIRPTKNGYPHPSAILPFSEVVLYPDNVNVNVESPSTKTLVNFPCPIFLEPGEYSVCLLSNSRDYTVYTATIGKTELSGTDRVSKEVYSGKLFRPQNTNVAEPDYTRDLTFCLNRCSFNTGSDKTFVLDALDSGITHGIDISRLVSYSLTPNGTSSEVTYSQVGGSRILENKNVNLLTQPTGITSSFSIKLQNTEKVSPVFDTNVTSVLHIENVFNDGGGDLDIQEKLPTTNEGGKSKYITKTIELKTPATDIRVFLDMVKTNTNKIHVYIKYRPESTSVDFDSLPYEKLTLQDETFSENENDIITEEYRISSLNTNKFAIKIVMTGTDDLSVPRIKGMRAIALSQ